MDFMTILNILALSGAGFAGGNIIRLLLPAKKANVWLQNRVIRPKLNQSLSAVKLATHLAGTSDAPNADIDHATLVGLIKVIKASDASKLVQIGKLIDSVELHKSVFAHPTDKLISDVFGWLDEAVDVLSTAPNKGMNKKVYEIHHDIWTAKVGELNNKKRRIIWHNDDAVKASIQKRHREKELTSSWN